MRKQFSDPAYQRLLSILRFIFSGIPVDTDAFSCMSDGEWAELFDAAARQGVLAITHDAIKAFPENVRPPLKVKLNWALSTESIEKRFAHQNAIAGQFAALLSEHDMRMMIFKGLSLSRYYPIPEHREFGDLDIWAFGDYDKVNKLVESRRIEVDYESDKHAVFTFNGVMVENHATLTNCNNSSERFIEQALTGYMGGVQLSDNGYYYPSPEFNILFVLRHSAKHFPSSGITLRHLLDWGLLLDAEAEKVDMEHIRTIVAESGHRRFWNALTIASGIILSKDFSHLTYDSPSGKEAMMMLDFIVNDNIPLSRNAGKTERLKFRLSHTLQSRIKYGIVPESYLRDRIWRSIISPRLK